MKRIFLIGPMGAGKSTIGKHLARELKMDFYDTDRVIEEHAGASLQWIFDLEGEQGFQKREAKVLQELVSKPNIVLATGGNIVISDKNREILTSNGTVVYLRLNLSTQFERTRKDSRRPQLEGKSLLKQTLEDLQCKLSPLYEEIADFIFETNNFSAKDVVRMIIGSIMQQQSVGCH
jgi:shikimate kinase